MTTNPLRELRIASFAFNDAVHQQPGNGKVMQKRLDQLNAEAHKFGLLVRIELEPNTEPASGRT